MRRKDSHLRSIYINKDMNTCLRCNTSISKSNKFCNKSCAASFNNAKRIPKIKHNCIQCGKEVPSNRNKFCSRICGWDHKKKNYSEEYIKAINRECYKRYIARRKYQTPIGEDIKAIQQFYLNCPNGYEVDHIMPISRGGSHSLENLQYLTKEENRRKSNKIL